MSPWGERMTQARVDCRFEIGHSRRTDGTEWDQWDVSAGACCGWARMVVVRERADTADDGSALKISSVRL